jgi:hypothetical protein
VSEGDDLRGAVLAHLHANSRLRVEQLAAMTGSSRDEVERAVGALVAAGHLERDGDRLVPDAASHPTPGLFVASERTDATSLEVDFSEDEDGED